MLTAVLLLIHHALLQINIRMNMLIAKDNILMFMYMMVHIQIMLFLLVQNFLEKNFQDNVFIIIMNVQDILLQLKQINTTYKIVYAVGKFFLIIIIYIYRFDSCWH